MLAFLPQKVAEPLLKIKIQAEEMQSERDKGQSNE